MKHFQKILAVLPEHHQAGALLAWSKLLAEASGAERIDFRQCLPAPLDIFPAEEVESSQPWNSDENHFLTEVASSLAGLPHTVETINEPPLSPILHQLAEGDYDLVLIAAQDREGRSLAERLARKSPVGVLVLPNQESQPVRRVLAALDFAELSKTVLNWAEDFAQVDPGQSCQLEAVHFTRIPTDARTTVAISPEVLKKMILDTETENLKSYINEQAKTPEKWQHSLHTGFAFGQEIARLGEASDGDLLVVGCQGRNAFSVAFLGSQAAEIIRNAECPVLVVKQKNASLGFLRQLLGLGQ